MIHDAIVPVTCDNPECYEEITLEPNYVYHSYSGESGQYDVSDSSLEKQLKNEQDWTVINGKHYCSQECADEAEDGKSS